MKRIVALLFSLMVIATVHADWYTDNNNYDQQDRYERAVYNNNRPYRPIRNTVRGATDTAVNVVDDTARGARNIVGGVLGF